LIGETTGNSSIRILLILDLSDLDINFYVLDVDQIDALIDGQSTLMRVELFDLSISLIMLVLTNLFLILGDIINSIDSDAVFLLACFQI